MVVHPLVAASPASPFAALARVAPSLPARSPPRARARPAPRWCARCRLVCPASCRRVIKHRRCVCEGGALSRRSLREWTPVNATRAHFSAGWCAAPCACACARSLLPPPPRCCCHCRAAAAAARAAAFHAAQVRYSYNNTQQRPGPTLVHTYVDTWNSGTPPPKGPDERASGSLGRGSIC